MWFSNQIINTKEYKLIWLSDEERTQFADLLQTSIPVTIHTREFDFGEVFMKLTGEKYQLSWILFVSHRNLRVIQHA